MLVLTVAVLLVANSNVGCAHPGYEMLNERLVSQSRIEDDVGMDIKTIVDLRNSISATDEEDSMRDAVNDFSAFLNVPIESPNCDAKELADLQRPIETLSTTPAGPLSRLERIVHTRRLKHAEQCLPKYPKIFDSLTRSADENVDQKTKLVSNFMAKLLEPRKGLQNVHHHICSNLLGREPLQLDVDALKVAEYIRDRRPGGQNRNRLSYWHFVEQPCKHYLAHFGQNLFEPFLFDANIFGNLVKAYIAVIIIRPTDNQEPVPFFEALASYVTCKAIDRNEPFKSSVLDFIGTD